MTHQRGITDPLTPAARQLVFALRPGADPGPSLRRLAAEADGEALVVGLGHGLVATMGARVPGLREATALSGPGVAVPSDPAALWLWVRGTDAGEVALRGRALAAAMEGAFELEELTDTFLHAGGRDLTGYEDGTENPKGDAALQAALVAGAGAGLDGGSFVATQRWAHDLAAFARHAGDAQDRMIGRRRSDNVELADAPASAHVKRTAQESFDPPAFVLRRSMPWADARGEGLWFVAFGRSFDAFEAQLHRMCGLEDGVTDALFRFTRPVSTRYFWCPPVAAGALDLSALGLG